MTHPTYLGDRDFISSLTEIVVRNLGKESFGVNELVHESGTSHSTLNRRLHRITGKTVNQFIKEKRLDKAMEMLLDHSGHISEIAHMTGFGSTAYFDKCFHERFGYPPGEVKKRYPGPEVEDNQGTTLNDKWPDLNKTKERILASQIRRPGIWVSSIASLAIISMAAIYVVFNYIFTQPFDVKALNKASYCSVAVLPFKPVSNSAGIKELADQLTDEIIVQLTEFPHLKVIHSGSMLVEDGVSPGIPDDDSNHRAQYALEGSVKGDGGYLKISASLIDLGNHYIIMSVSYSAEPDSISLVSQRIVQKVANQLNASTGSK